jgi:long-subunit fatty acid transport protein
VPSRTFSPLLPDADRHIVALGLGYQGGRHAVDFVWTLNFVDDRTIAGNQVPPFDGVYEIDPQLIALSYRYSFN